MRVGGVRGHALVWAWRWRHRRPRGIFQGNGSITQERAAEAGGGDLETLPEAPRPRPIRYLSSHPPPAVWGHPSGPLLQLSICDSLSGRDFWGSLPAAPPMSGQAVPALAGWTQPGLVTACGLCSWQPQMTSPEEGQTSCPHGLYKTLQPGHAVIYYPNN